MKSLPPKNAVSGLVVGPEFESQIRAHMMVLGHRGLGVTELRAVVDGRLWVAYADSVDAVLELCRQMEGRASAVYVGVQPRPAHRFDQAPNRWVLARGGPAGNCARDDDIEYVVGLVWDFDVVSPPRQQGHPASDEELERTFLAAQLVGRHEGLALCYAIVCTANGHQLWVPIIPISVDRPQVALQFKLLCGQIAADVAGKVDGVRIDPIYNLSRVARVAGTWNLKGRPLPDRPHRRACFVTELPLGRSLALHYMILNTEVQEVIQPTKSVPTGLKCDLARIEECEFIQWCRQRAQEVSEPQWFALIGNLVYLEGGIELIHAISALDGGRYDYAETQRVIERVLREGYKPASCRTIMSPAMTRLGRGVFRCSRIGTCRAKAPMYMAAIRAIQQE
jgi:hypothetical protein